MSFNNYTSFGTISRIRQLNELFVDDIEAKNADFDNLDVKDLTVQNLETEGTLTITGDLDLQNNKLINVADPTLVQDGANKNYVDSTVSTHEAKETGIHGVGAGSVVGTDLIQTLTNKSVNTTADQFSIDENSTNNNNKSILFNRLDLNNANITYDGSTITANKDLCSTANLCGNALYLGTNQAIYLNGGTKTLSYNGVEFAINDQLNMTNNKLTNVADPTDQQDAASKNYVDTGLNNKADLSYTNLQLALKRDILDSYSKTEVDNLISGINLAMSNLSDVNLSGLADNQMLIYDTATSKWKVRDSNVHEEVIVGLNGVGDKSLIFRNDLNGNGTIVYCDLCDLFEVNKALQSTDFKLVGGVSIKESIFDVTPTLPGQTWIFGSEPNFWDIDKTDLSANYIVDPLCACKFSALSISTHFYVTTRRDPSTSTSNLTATAGKKIYVEFSVGNTTANMLHEVYFVMQDHDTLTESLHRWNWRQNGGFGWPTTPMLGFWTSDQKFGSILADRTIGNSTFPPNVPSVNQRFGIELDFISDVIRLWNVDLGINFLTQPQNLSADWQNVKNGLASCRFGINPQGISINAGSYVQIYNENDSLGMGLLSGTPEHYLTTASYGGGGGAGENYEIKFYDKTTVDDALDLKSNVVDVYTKTQIDAQHLNFATTTDLTNHTSATVAHGTISAVVGVSDVQVITNKSVNTTADQFSIDENSTNNNNKIISFNRLDANDGTITYDGTTITANKDLCSTANLCGNALYLGTNEAIYLNGGTKTLSYNGVEFAINDQLNMTNNKLTNVADPTVPQDGATKNYVDAQVSGGLSGLTGVPADIFTINTDATNAPSMVRIKQSSGNGQLEYVFGGGGGAPDDLILGTTNNFMTIKQDVLGNQIIGASGELTISVTGKVGSIKIDTGGVKATNRYIGNNDFSDIYTSDMRNYEQVFIDIQGVIPSLNITVEDPARTANNHYIYSHQLFVESGADWILFNGSTPNSDITSLLSPPDAKGVKISYLPPDLGNLNDEIGNPYYNRPSKFNLEIGSNSSWSGQNLRIILFYKFN